MKYPNPKFLAPHRKKYTKDLPVTSRVPYLYVDEVQCMMEMRNLEKTRKEIAQYLEENFQVAARLTDTKTAAEKSASIFTAVRTVDKYLSEMDEDGNWIDLADQNSTIPSQELREKYRKDWKLKHGQPNPFYPYIKKLVDESLLAITKKDVGKADSDTDSDDSQTATVACLPPKPAPVPTDRLKKAPPRKPAPEDVAKPAAIDDFDKAMAEMGRSLKERGITAEQLTKFQPKIEEALDVVGPKVLLDVVYPGAGKKILEFSKDRADDEATRCMQAWLDLDVDRVLASMGGSSSEAKSPPKARSSPSAKKNKKKKDKKKKKKSLSKTIEAVVPKPTEAIVAHSAATSDAKPAATAAAEANDATAPEPAAIPDPRSSGTTVPEPDDATAAAADPMSNETTVPEPTGTADPKFSEASTAKPKSTTATKPVTTAAPKLPDLKAAVSPAPKVLKSVHFGYFVLYCLFSTIYFYFEPVDWKTLGFWDCVFVIPQPSVHLINYFHAASRGLEPHETWKITAFVCAVICSFLLAINLWLTSPKKPQERTTKTKGKVAKPVLY